MSILQKLASFKTFSARVWALSAPYFQSDQKWKARGLLVAIVLLNLGAVYMLVLLNDWNRLFYDALQNKQADVFWTQLGRFTYLAFAFILIAVYKFYLTQLLEMRWRAWMTAHYLERWLANKAFYKLELTRFTQPQSSTAVPDNPDQRIQEDINQFTSYSVSRAWACSMRWSRWPALSAFCGRSAVASVSTGRAALMKSPASWCGWRCFTASRAASPHTTSGAR